MRRAIPCSLALLLVSACAAGGGPPPSLQPRAAERIDPRVPVERPLNDRAATPALLARLEALIGQAREGEARFEVAIAIARRSAEGAGPPQSESWIVAQEALSGAVEARGAAAFALGEIDSHGAELLAEQGGLAPSDLKAIEDAAATVGAINSRQAAAIAEVQARLSS